VKSPVQPRILSASLLVLASVVVLSPAGADDGAAPGGEPAVPADERAAPVGDPPVGPPPVVSGEPLQPEVRIRETGRETVYEYRRNGQLYLVRVVPRVGPPYHFYDFDGDGALDYRPGEPMHHNIHQWTLFRW
jgi:hypothetical protein